MILRKAHPLDAGQIGDILHRFETETPWMPKEHTAAEILRFCDVMIDRGWVSVAVREHKVLGFVALDGVEICSLYVAPDMRGQGVGKALLSHAKTLSPELRLHTFQANTPAQRFYQREGFREVGRSDGRQHSEGLPDISYHWQHPDAANQNHQPEQIV
ncbi:GNAT family N-acetyltransferase [Epibacterium sp. SM1969]|uniref:GNAT family N-acetyltransferase n=1 Tax=Tritonibacter aquimaris TaxID=2663379 RepID=A0A844ASI1_9RHOB|nr:GNAT family N-acetyltransferase [Tritonibacter aquimaris]MQY42218.1 GNAT family N-acetyltransferase [Tritonibacter aquimaris]